MTRAKQSDPGAALDALAISAFNKSKSALLRTYHAKIIAAQNAGAPQSEIVHVLKENGIDVSIGMLRNFLHREKKRAASRDSSAPVPNSTLVNHSEPPSVSNSKTSDPSAIDKIVNSTPDLDALAKIHRSQSK